MVGSSAMLAEAAHSAADSLDQVLFFYVRVLEQQHLLGCRRRFTTTVLLVSRMAGIFGEAPLSPS